MVSPSKRTVVSGIRATGTLHLGNYLGAIRQCVELAQDERNDCHFFVADLHTMTTRPDPKDLLRYRRGVVLDFLAAGIDPERATIYTQSSVPETTELMWILSCLTPVSELMRMHHFADKRDELEQHGLVANTGLLIYPVLMAADILGPRANVVPVGDDQRAHVEMARNLAQRFNQMYGDLFPVPELRIRDERRVPSLKTPGKKMGKSDEDGVIPLDVAPERLKKLLRQAFTDPARDTRDKPGTPGICNIYTLHQFVSPRADLEWAHDGCTTAGIGCGDCKERLGTNLNLVLQPIRERRADLLARPPGYIDEILHEGGRRARARIQETVARAKELAGIPAAQAPTNHGGSS